MAIDDIIKALRQAKSDISDCQTLVDKFQQDAIVFGSQSIPVTQAVKDAIKVEFEATRQAALVQINSIPDVTSGP